MIVLPELLIPTMRASLSAPIVLGVKGVNTSMLLSVSELSMPLNHDPCRGENGTGRGPGLASSRTKTSRIGGRGVVCGNGLALPICASAPAESLSPNPDPDLSDISLLPTRICHLPRPLISRDRDRDSDGPVPAVFVPAARRDLILWLRLKTGFRAGTLAHETATQTSIMLHKLTAILS